MRRGATPFAPSGGAWQPSVDAARPPTVARERIPGVDLRRVSNPCTAGRVAAGSARAHI
jgi:hypothetical protein